MFDDLTLFDSDMLISRRDVFDNLTLFDYLTLFDPDMSISGRDVFDNLTLFDNLTYSLCVHYPSCCLGKVKVDSIDDVEEMQIMDEAFDILGFKW